MPDCVKPTSLPRRGLKIRFFTLVQTIAMPLALVAVDVASDGNLLFYMKSYIGTQWATNTTSFTINCTNVTEQHSITSLTERGSRQGETTLDGLFYLSCIILLASMLNLIFGNPSKTLIRNARTSVFMASRELESKDVPLPIGDNIMNIEGENLFNWVCV